MSRWRPALIVGICLAVLAAGGYLVLTWSGSIDGQRHQAGGSDPGVVPDPSGPDDTAPRPPGGAITYWPGPTTTGVPAGTRLTNSGPLTLRRDGQVISNVHITGCVSVYARNVTIRRSKITCDSPTFAVRTFDTARDLVIEDVEIDGGGHNSTAVCCGDYTLRRANVHHTTDGPRLGPNSTVVDSWVHDLTRAPGSHNDTLQTTAGSTIVVRHNRLDAYRPSIGDPMNACLMIGSTSGPAVRDLLVEDNYCNGGNYSIGVRADLTGSDIRFRGNRFGRDYRYGVIARPRQVGIVWESSNVWLDNGRPVVM